MILRVRRGGRSTPAVYGRWCSAPNRNTHLADQSGTLAPMDPSLTPVLIWIGALALIAVGLAGTVIPALPGVPLVFGGLWLIAWSDDYSKVGGWILGLLGVLVVVSM